MSRTKKGLILFTCLFLWIAGGVLAGRVNEDLTRDILGFGGIGLLVIALIYGLAKLAGAITDRERGIRVKQIFGSAFAVVGFFFVAAVVVSGVASFWQSYVANRTAAVRQVFLRGANSEHAPEVYMNDGTVWMLEDSADNVKMIAGDEVRYTYMGASATYWPEGAPASDSPDKCGLKDVTTGYYSWADRLSAPFTHTSCPEK